MSSSSEMKNTLQNFRIPLEEIKLATNNFHKKYLIGAGGLGPVYKGKLSERWGNRTAAIKRRGRNSYQGKEEFEFEIQKVSTFHHQNIIPFIGYCVECEEMIIVYEYAINGSLDDHLCNIGKRSSLTWVQRLKICLGAAQGLKYLHSGFGDNRTIIHRDVKSANIFLDNKMEAKISDFGLSRSCPKNQPHTKLYTRVVGTIGYIDLIYLESCILTEASDIYSFGVVMFEMLTGKLAYGFRSIEDDGPRSLIDLVRRNWDDGLDKIIDPYISDQINRQSLQTFQKVAYNCTSSDLEKRPTIDSIIEKLQKAVHFQIVAYVIPLEKIILATNNFDEDNEIGRGGYGVVFKGKLSIDKENRVTAIKCLHPDKLHRIEEFKKELEMVSRFHHKNIIPFIGYCEKGNEMIMVYEYASNGSLDDYLYDIDKRSKLT